ncbi:MAG: NAD(P)-binding protein [Polyangiaceae bacterium]|nr:NAD(P)-binding protein [Polyangiaceae bacterium]
MGRERHHPKSSRPDPRRSRIHGLARANRLRPAVVVGGGLTGLVAALRLVERGAEVILVESATRLGGQIHSTHPEGICVELGAEGFVARSEVMPRLCNELGIGDSLIDQTSTTTYAFTRGNLVELPPGEAATLLGFQVPKEELGRGIRSLRGGMGEVIDALERRLAGRASIRTGELVSAIERRDSGLHVSIEAGSEIEASAVIITAASRVASSILGRAFGAPAQALARGRMTSSASVSLLYELSSIGKKLEGSGFIVPQDEQTDGFRAASYASIKLARPVPEGTVLLRAFFRPTAQDVLDRSESAWVDLAVRHVSEALDISGAPLGSWASIWSSALPVYDDAYRAAVAAAEAVLHPASVFLAGSHYHGAGIDAAVRSAERIAASIDLPLSL